MVVDAGRRGSRLNLARPNVEGTVRFPLRGRTIGLHEINGYFLKHIS